MRTIAVIPARYGSSRLRGKPLMDICGRPMLWWVYHRVRQSRSIDGVYIATDHDEIMRTCRQYSIPCMMTDKEHKTSTERVYEVAKFLPADIYVCVNGDEPLIEPSIVEKVVPERVEGFFAANLMTKISSPVETVDDTNIKVVTDEAGDALYFSRSPIPHPKASIRFDYYKHLGVLAYSPEALRFFARTPRGRLEQVEDINELRFVEHGKKLRMIPVDADTLSVDTLKDLDYVRHVVAEKIKKGELTL